MCLSMVLLLLFGGHMGVARCACSGGVSLLIFNSDLCCAGDEGCVQVTIAETDDYVPSAVVSLDTPAAMEALCSSPYHIPAPFAMAAACTPQYTSTPPARHESLSMVMRV